MTVGHSSVVLGFPVQYEVFPAALHQERDMCTWSRWQLVSYSGVCLALSVEHVW